MVEGFGWHSKTPSHGPRKPPIGGDGVKSAGIIAETNKGVQNADLCRTSCLDMQVAVVRNVRDNTTQRHASDTRMAL